MMTTMFFPAAASSAVATAPDVARQERDHRLFRVCGSSSESTNSGPLHAPPKNLAGAGTSARSPAHVVACASRGGAIARHGATHALASDDTRSSAPAPAPAVGGGKACPHTSYGGRVIIRVGSNAECLSPLRPNRARRDPSQRPRAHTSSTAVLDRCGERACSHGSVEGRATDAARAGRGCADLRESTRPIVEVQEARR